MKKLLAFILAAMMVLSLTAALAEGEAPAQEAKYYKFYNIIKHQSAYFDSEAKAMQAKIKELSKKYNFDYDFMYIDCENDPEKCMTSLETAIADKAAAITICVPDQSMSPSIVERCAEAGIPVVAVDDSMIDETGAKICPWVGIDAFNVGYAAGEWLANYAKDNNLLDNPEVGLIFMTMDTVTSAVPRVDGAKAAWKDINGDALADRTYNADYVTQAELAYDAAASVITAHPEIKIWLASSASESGNTGLDAVLEEQGLADRSIQIAMGADMTVDQWEDGNWKSVKCADYFSGIAIGMQVYENILDYLEFGKELPAEFAVPSVLLTPENYKESYVYAEDLDWQKD